MKRFGTYASLVALALLCVQCGKNLATNPIVQVGAPQNLRALSVDVSTVELFWTPPSGASDTTLLGYRLQWGNKVDSVSKSTLSFVVDSLTPGTHAFEVASERSDGSFSQFAMITWAAAARFNTPLTLIEYDLSNVQTQGLHVGSQAGQPEVLSMDPSNEQLVDLYFFGRAGTQLLMLSASQFSQGWNPTMFSTEADAAQSLDLPLSAFPDPNTFTQVSIPVTDNTIYYAKAVNATQSYNYARIFVHLLGGTYPQRSVAVTVSLQPVETVPYAEAGTGSSRGSALTGLVRFPVR